MAVGKKEQLVAIGRVAVPAAEAVYDRIVCVQGVEAPGDGIEVGQPSVRLHLEVEAHSRELAMEVGRAVVLEDHEVGGFGDPAKDKIAKEQPSRSGRSVHSGLDVRE